MILFQCSYTVFIMVLVLTAGSVRAEKYDIESSDNWKFSESESYKLDLYVALIKIGSKVENRQLTYDESVVLSLVDCKECTLTQKVLVGSYQQDACCMPGWKCWPQKMKRNVRTEFLFEYNPQNKKRIEGNERIRLIWSVENDQDLQKPERHISYAKVTFNPFLSGVIAENPEERRRGELTRILEGLYHNKKVKISTNYEGKQYIKNHKVKHELSKNTSGVRSQGVEKGLEIWDGPYSSVINLEPHKYSYSLAQECFLFYSRLQGESLYQPQWKQLKGKDRLVDDLFYTGEYFHICSLEAEYTTDGGKQVRKPAFLFLNPACNMDQLQEGGKTIGSEDLITDFSQYSLIVIFRELSPLNDSVETPGATQRETVDVSHQYF